MSRVLALCLAALLGSSANAANMAFELAGPPSAGLVASQITETEWNLKHSSVAGAISKAVQDDSLGLLARARAEVAAGNTRTAQELTRRAARPLSTMDAAARAGKHPDSGARDRKMAVAIASIIDGAERIAREKELPADFATAARRELIKADAMTRRGEIEAARELRIDTYIVVQSEVARMRSGDLVFIDLPSSGGEHAWVDGLRRLEERRQLTDYLIVEAEQVGVDAAPLREAVIAASRSLTQAAGMARERRWEQALASLETAYLLHEASWRAVGVEW